MTKRTIQIGFSQRVRLEWLEQTANLVLAGKERSAVSDALQELLIDKVSVGGNAQRGNREKIVTILLKAWLTVPTELETLRVEGLDLFKRSPQHDHLAIHWGMVIAAYPFWSGVAVQVGRLLRLQGSAAAVKSSVESENNTASGRPFPEQPAVYCAPTWTGVCFRKAAQLGFTPPVRHLPLTIHD